VGASARYPRSVIVLSRVRCLTERARWAYHAEPKSPLRFRSPEGPAHWRGHPFRPRFYKWSAWKRHRGTATEEGELLRDAKDVCDDVCTISGQRKDRRKNVS